MSITINKEILCFLLFILTNFFTNRLLFQAIILFFYFLTLYLINKDLNRSFWIILLSTIFFSSGRYFSFKFNTSFSAGVESYKVFGFNFTDLTILLFIYFLKRNEKKVDIKITVADFVLFLIISLGIFSSSLSPHAEIAWFNLFQFLKLISLFYISRIIIWKKDFWQLTLLILFIYLILNSILMLAEWIMGGPLGLAIEDYFVRYGNYAQDALSLYRPGGMVWDANFAASLLIVGFIILFTTLINGHSFFSKKIDLTILLLFVSAILISASRGVWLVVFFCLIILLTKVIFKSHSTKMDNFLKTGILFFVSMIIIFGKYIANRFLQFFSKMGISTIQTRLVHLKLAYLISLDYPIGTGLNTFQYQIMSMFKPKTYLFDSTPSHMMVGEILSDFGFYGLLLFFVFFYLILRKNYGKSFKKKSIFYVVISYLFLAEIYPLLFYFQISAIFWIMLGALYSYDKYHKN